MYSIQYDRTTDKLSLQPRPSFLELDEHGFVDETDTLGPLHVCSGLTPNDLVTFLRFHANQSGEVSLPEEPVGYLVSQVDRGTEGSGIIVGSQLIEAAPAAWATPRIERMLKLLLALEGYTPEEEFGLRCLTRYLRSKGSGA